MSLNTTTSEELPGMLRRVFRKFEVAKYTSTCFTRIAILLYKYIEQNILSELGVSASLSVEHFPLEYPTPFVRQKLVGD